jgi:hypothetical protein
LPLPNISPVLVIAPGKQPSPDVQTRFDLTTLKTNQAIGKRRSKAIREAALIRARAL